MSSDLFDLTSFSGVWRIESCLMFCAGRARQRLAANQRSRDQSEHGPKRAGAERHFIHLQSVDARRGPTNCRERPRNAVDARGFVTADHLTLSARINPKVRDYMQLQPDSEAGVGRGTAFAFAFLPRADTATEASDKEQAN